MGYALFFARKLALTTRVNNLNAQLMSVSNAQNNLANEIAAKQNAANLRSAYASKQAYSTYSDAVNNGGDADAARAVLDDALANNKFGATESDAEIQMLNMQQNNLDMQRETLETQLQAAQAELQSVEKAEESAIKSSAPGYVG